VTHGTKGRFGVRPDRRKGALTRRELVVKVDQLRREKAALEVALRKKRPKKEEKLLVP
jgi:hypothetical protein